MALKPMDKQAVLTQDSGRLREGDAVTIIAAVPSATQGWGDTAYLAKRADEVQELLFPEDFDFTD